jgi:hypothetical protein
MKQNKSPNKSVNKTSQHQMLHTVRTILHQNYFRFHDKFYKRPKGVAMGISTSGLTAEIFLLCFGNLVIKHITQGNCMPCTKPNLLRQAEGTRGVGKPKLRWLDSVEEDVKNIGVRNLRRMSQDRQQWKAILEEDEVHQEL